MSRDRVDDAEGFLSTLVTNATPEERNDAFISLIQFIRQTKGPEAALARVEAALAEEDTGNSVWQVLRGSLIFDIGRREEGIAAVEGVLDTDVPLPPQEMLDTKIVLGQMLLTNGNEVGARKQIEEVLADDPKNTRALKMRAGWLIGDDETTAAINDLRLALDQDPDDADIMVLMAQAYERAGNSDLMQSFLASAVQTSNNAPRYTLLLAESLSADDRFLDAESALIASLRLAPGNVDVLSALGGVYLQLDDMPRADQVAKTLKNIDTPEAQSSGDNLQAEVIVRQLGVDQALEFLEEQATDAEKGDAFAKLVLIQARLRAGKMEEALSFAKAAVAEEPEDLRLRNALALSYAAAQDFEAAEREFEAVLQARPDAVTIYLQLARLRGAQDQAEAARQTIDEGLSQVPDAPDLLWAKASYLQQEGNIDGAIDIYEGLYTRNSGSLVVANNLASLLATYREDESSLARAEVIARRLEGTEVPAFQDTYGWLLFRRGEVQDALPYLEGASAGLPQDPTVQLHLGEVYAALNRRTDALAQLNKALEVAGPLADEALKARIQNRIAEVSAASDN
jgi:predicted Zn-dependent protease